MCSAAAERREPPLRRSGGPRSRPAPNWGRFVGHSERQIIVSKSEQRTAVGCGRLQGKPQPRCGFPQYPDGLSAPPRAGAALWRGLSEPAGLVILLGFA